MVSYKITQDTFFKTGRLCFFLIAILSAFNIVWTWNPKNIFGILIAIFYVIFYFALSMYFNWMVQNQPTPVEIPAMTEEEIQKMIERNKKKSKS